MTAVATGGGGAVSLSYSEITTHRRCPQRWVYRYERGLERVPDPDDPQPELNFGTWWHALVAVDAVARGRDHGSLRSAPKRLSFPGGKIPAEGMDVRSVLAAARSWWDALTAEAREAFVGRMGEPVADRLSALYDEWRDEWRSEREHERPLAVEMRWERELLPGTVLVGYVDEVVYDEERRIVLVRDHKSMRSLPARSAVDDMMDSQLQLYAWGASPQVTRWGMGRIMATGYDRVRSVRATEPKLTLAGTLSKSVTDYGLNTYLAWVGGGVEYPGRKKDGSDAGVYRAEESVVERLATPAARSAWFQRTRVPVNTNIVRAHLSAAAATASDIAATGARASEEGDTGRNLGPDCKWCDFASLCRAQMFGGPDGDYDPAEHGLRVGQ